MKKILHTVAFVLAVSSSQAVLAVDDNLSHMHLGHVLTSWADTPEQQGLMTTAIGEAKIANQHANAAAKKPEDLEWMKMHALHVLHALDPAKAMQGPGMNYGLVKAAQGVVKHIKAAASQADASEALKLHAVHVATSAQNVVDWGTEAEDICAMIADSEDATDAAELVTRLTDLSHWMESGVDANGDGNISWEKGEGGLAASLKHAGIIAKLDGVN